MVRSTAAVVASGAAQDATSLPESVTLGLAEQLPWLRDGQLHFERGPRNCR